MIKEELNQVIQVMSKTYGRDISMYDECFVEKSIKKRWIAVGVKTYSGYFEYLLQNSVEGEALFSSLNNTYSEFFRNPLVFALMEQLIIPKIIEEKSGKEIRVWSAGCASGQEAYSIAMLLDNHGASVKEKIHFRVFATDISQEVLAAAREGVYNFGTVQNVKLKYLDKYFIKKGETYRISSRLKECVSFSIYDLLDKRSANPWESIYGDFDLVFCSNLLFYYRPEFRQFIMEKVTRSTALNGYLVTGEAERAFVEKIAGLIGLAPPASVFQRKRHGGVQ